MTPAPAAAPILKEISRLIREELEPQITEMEKYFPGDPPMSYYEGNVVNKIRGFLHHLI